jgi:hypothetical protein
MVHGRGCSKGYNLCGAACKTTYYIMQIFSIFFLLLTAVELDIRDHVKIIRMLNGMLFAPSILQSTVTWQFSGSPLLGGHEIRFEKFRENEIWRILWNDAKFKKYFVCAPLILFYVRSSRNFHGRDPRNSRRILNQISQSSPAKFEVYNK